MGAGLSIDEMSRGEIEPGAEGVLNLTFTPSHDTPAGSIERSITIHPKSGHAQQSFRVVAAVSAKPN